MSEALHQEQRVPQGSILSVTLFSLKINNIVKCLNPGVDCSLYVDDFLICYRSNIYCFNELRHQRSTNDHLVRLETFICEAFIKKEHLVAFFFDLERAYDTTWKYGIMNDLHEIGLKGRLPVFVQNFLSNREFKVCVGSTLSETHNQEQGVPQGSILSVTLFSLKINNIVKCLNPGADCSLYVDDFLICYRSKNMNTIERQFQLNLNKIQK